VSPTKPRAPERHLLSQTDLQRMQGPVARKGGGEVPKGSYIGRMQRHMAQVTRGKGAKMSRTPAQEQHDNDNHSNQLNPNNDEYWNSRGEDERPDDWEERQKEQG
jgi:hypothetical protein